jgi:predicted tellurium resistance membrane protein TerC
MLITPFLLSLLVAVLCLIVGYFVLENGRAAFQVGGYIIIMLLGVVALSSGVEYPGENTIIIENATTNSTTITQEPTTNSTANTLIGGVLTILALFGFFKGVEKTGEEHKTPY